MGSTRISMSTALCHSSSTGLSRAGSDLQVINICKSGRPALLGYVEEYDLEIGSKKDIAKMTNEHLVAEIIKAEGSYSQASETALLAPQHDILDVLDRLADMDKWEILDSLVATNTTSRTRAKELGEGQDFDTVLEKATELLEEAADQADEDEIGFGLEETELSICKDDIKKMDKLAIEQFLSANQMPPLKGFETMGLPESRKALATRLLL